MRLRIQLKNNVPSGLTFYEEMTRLRVARVRYTSRDVSKGLDDKQRTVEYKQFLIAHGAVNFAQDAPLKH